MAKEYQIENHTVELEYATASEASVQINSSIPAKYVKFTILGGPSNDTAGAILLLRSSMVNSPIGAILNTTDRGLSITEWTFTQPKNFQGLHKFSLVRNSAAVSIIGRIVVHIEIRDTLP